MEEPIIPENQFNGQMGAQIAHLEEHPMQHRIETEVPAFFTKCSVAED